MRSTPRTRRHGLTSPIVEGGSGNVWKENGFYFNTSAVFVTSAAFTFGTNYTFELLVDAPGGASGQPKSAATFLSHLGGYVRGAVVYKQGALTLLHQTDNLRILKNRHTMPDTAGTEFNSLPYTFRSVRFSRMDREGAFPVICIGQVNSRCMPVDFSLSCRLHAGAAAVVNAAQVNNKNILVRGCRHLD